MKGGGHSSNPGFSSTSGVQIAMTRFNNVTYHADTQTADIGTGIVWDDVYSALAPYNVNVVGGRVTGVGVAGFTLGGGTVPADISGAIAASAAMLTIERITLHLCGVTGYSWKTSQHGLTIDTLEAFELVLPNGTVTTVTSEDEDLFFALKVSSLPIGFCASLLTLVTSDRVVSTTT